ncbi:PP2C family serine/threonine-protein phosphatase [Aspergillus fijiensis CBS 313.89]|uniref:Protein serine/threonine phosphatase 2C n=1 Tax=Aspergillus fijiensis CBS 313.89 TaxID=1448319 RepID=A0A8G1VWM1_9EURO|nr:protein serine/threonine phosphatase 2C [Aspergillus fijiensis CBS 313.89]RAK74341.1 protein serine/threonine phosphatase 2C [Aspergillus fijiensis CBS 313.89]
MLPQCGIRSSLGRAARNPVFRQQTKKFHYAKRSPATQLRYLTATGLAATSGLYWWWSSANRDGVPLPDEAPAQNLVVQPPFPHEEVTRTLSKDSYSFSVRDVPGIDRHDGAQLASNSPCEDRLTYAKFSSPWHSDKEPWMAWAVFDGHAGWQTAELLKNQLVPSVRHSLSQVTPIPDEIQSVAGVDTVPCAISNAFVNLDDAIFKTAMEASQSNEPLHQRVRDLLPAFAGSCALLSIFDPDTSALHVACTGDSRAVLGRQQPDGRWETIPLSIDQTGSNEEEIARIYSEHPGEEDIVQGGRVLGLMASRAFGDCRWKWPVEFQQEIRQRFYGPAPLTPRYDIRTPPYVTAQPVVTTVNIDPAQPSFLIMATDGLWDMLSSQQAVELVGKWLSGGAETGKGSSTSPAASDKPFDFGHFWESVNWKFVEGRTTVQDDNVAVHLVRNCLGGSDLELLKGRLAFDPPFSRTLRDDITVQVVFFGVPNLKNKDKK